ncbi:cytosolic phospholipase A2 gamma-like [Conger conger]|uniref:cytosolic phospholipase A2 gamma-like n=1 Tax=Conger conger TaxID=82655 RepID=UPI002A5A794A|nr:cytosolic phospholipase A2 gamma-like [Conger conger]
MWFFKEAQCERVRLAKSLNEGEIKFVQERMKNVEKCMKDHGIQCESKSVPRIAVLGSGGGQRAMIGLLGCIDQMYNENLLNCILYLCGVSGSTWCMTSMYEEPAWSSKFPSVKDDLVKRLTETDIDVSELVKWLSQAVDDENFSLTDFWAATVVYGFVKKINTTRLSDLRNLEATNPYPIYTVNDQGLKDKGDKIACWFELSPHEVGYSHLGAFVDTSTSRSQFEAGVLKQKAAERDMLYLQGSFFSSVLGFGSDEKSEEKEKKEEEGGSFFSRILGFGSEEKEETEKVKEEKIEEEEEKEGGSFFSRVLGFGSEEKEEEKEEEDDDEDEEDDEEEGGFFSSMTEKFFDYIPLDDMASDTLESIFNLFDCDDDEENKKHVDKIHKTMTDVNTANVDKPKKNLAGKSKEEKEESLIEYALDAFGTFQEYLPGLSDVTKITLKTMSLMSTWTWGTKYNFLYKFSMNESTVPEEVVSDELSYLEDAGLVLNSPYVAALRPERNVNLILSFDFSAGDPFMTVTQAAEHCKQTGIPFPPVEITEEDRKQPKDFYVFKSENTPTVIHIPLFNMVNCEGDVQKWRETYPTFRPAYDRETMDELIRVSGLNVKNNKAKIIQEIAALCK